MRNSIKIKAACSLIFLLSVAIIVLLIYSIDCIDLSMQSPYKITSEQKKTDYCLISYADGSDVYYKNRNMLSFSAINNGFDFILNYRREHIDPSYVVQNPILQEKTGAGFWLWKPYLILKSLNSVPDGTVVMYADSGMFIRQPIREYFDHGLSISGKDVLLFNYDPEVYGYSSRVASGDIFAAINCTEERCRNGHHVWAAIVVVRNSVNSRKFIAEWLKLCEREELLRGTANTISNCPEYSYHQHDESILSALSARDSHMVNFLPVDEKFWQHIKNHRRKDDDESLIKYIITHSLRAKIGSLRDKIAALL